jgi:hypothetical protein
MACEAVLTAAALAATAVATAMSANACISVEAAVRLEQGSSVRNVHVDLRDVLVQAVPRAE